MVQAKLHHRSFQVLDYKLPGIYYMPAKPKMGFVLWLYGSESNKEKHSAMLKKIANQTNMPAFCFDYSGHGEAPFDLRKTTAAQHLLEVISVYDELCKEFGCGGGVVIGASYGAFMLLNLLQYRRIVAGILRVPALLRPSSFYTYWDLVRSDEERHWRNDPKIIAENPLIKHGADNTAPILVVEHSEDQEIPSQIPRLIAKRFKHAEYWLAEGFEHSLASASPAQCREYEDHLIAWLNRL